MSKTDNNNAQRIRRSLVLIARRIVPLCLLIILLPQLQRWDVVVTYAILFLWMIAEVLVEDPVTNPESRNSSRDRGSRYLILGAHLLALWLPLGELILRPTTPPMWLSLLGIGFAIVGAMLRIISIRTLGRFFTGYVRLVKDQRLCRKGVYKYIRHPSYVGLFFINLSLAVAVGASVSLVVLMLLSIMSIYYRVRIEEEELVKWFGESYRDYQQTTSRWVPIVWRREA